MCARVSVYIRLSVCVCVYTVSLMSLPLFIVNKIIGFFPRPWKRTRHKTDSNNTNRLILAVRVPFGLLCAYPTALRRSFEQCAHKSEPCLRDRGKSYSFFTHPPTHPLTAALGTAVRKNLTRRSSSGSLSIFVRRPLVIFTGLFVVKMFWPVFFRVNETRSRKPTGCTLGEADNLGSGEITAYCSEIFETHRTGVHSRNSLVFCIFTKIIHFFFLTLLEYVSYTHLFILNHFLYIRNTYYVLLVYFISLPYQF